MKSIQGFCSLKKFVANYQEYTNLSILFFPSKAANYHCGLPRFAPHRHHFQAPPRHLRLRRGHTAPSTTTSSSKAHHKKKQGNAGTAPTNVGAAAAAKGASTASAPTAAALPHKNEDAITNHASFFGVGAATNRFFRDVLLPLAVHDRKRLEQMVVLAFHTEEVQRIVSGYLRPLQVWCAREK